MTAGVSRGTVGAVETGKALKCRLPEQEPSSNHDRRLSLMAWALPVTPLRRLGFSRGCFPPGAFRPGDGACPSCSCVRQAKWRKSARTSLPSRPQNTSARGWNWLRERSPLAADPCRSARRRWLASSRSPCARPLE